MTGDLVPLPTFEGREIRVIEQAGEVWIPLADLATAWGVDRTTPLNLVSRNKDLFGGMVTDVTGGDVTSPAMLAVNERGLYLLMGKISADRLKNKDARAAILRFQRWVPELIQQYRKGEIQQAGELEISSELARAKYLADQTGGNLASFQAVALKKCGLEEYVPALNVPVVVHGEAGVWLNATQIGTRCGHSAREVNHFLEWNRFQYKQDGAVWRLTEKGEQHGEEYWIETASKHREIRIRWKESILTASGLIREQPALAEPVHG